MIDNDVHMPLIQSAHSDVTVFHSFKPKVRKTFGYEFPTSNVTSAKETHLCLLKKY